MEHEKYYRKLEKLFAEVKSLRKVALAAQEAERRFMAIDDGFFTGLVPPEFGDLSMALREWK